MKTNYDISDLGYDYKNIASVPSKKIKLGKWTITDIPVDIPDEKAYNIVKNFLDGIVALEIPTSLKCNLRCEYCYITDPRMKNKNVKEEDILKILNSSAEMLPEFNHVDKNKKRKKKLYFSPWGAEPMCNDNIEVLYEYAHEHYGKGNYSIHTSTNGTIWNERIGKLFDNLIDDGAMQSIQVSLDGPESLQNKQRPFTDGSPSYDKIKSFVHHLIDLQKEKKIKNRLYNFCSTIHLIDDNFADNWIAAAEFFSEPNKWYTSLPSMPMRMSGEDMKDNNYIIRFIEAQRRFNELARKKIKQGILCIDFYTAKLFNNIQNRSKNAFPFCSAMNSQIAIDFDGSMYPCHGPITTPKNKAFLWYGNIFDKEISFKKLYRNMNYQYGSIWTRVKCKDCELFHFSGGDICWTCPTHNLAMTGEPSIDGIPRCIAYQESFKYWADLAKLCIDSPIVDALPDNITNDLMCNREHINEETIKKFKVDLKKMHFDPRFNGLIINSNDKFNCLNCRDGNVDLYDTWWDMDNYYNKEVI